MAFLTQHIVACSNIRNYSRLILMILLLVLFGIFSASVTIFNVYLMSYLQTNVNTDYLGRVFSLIFVISGIFVPIGSLLAATIDLKDWRVFQLIGIGQILIYLSRLITFRLMSKKA
ncbi:hypothetical protein LA20533_02305 [Amylolactobacillus amylophilus DSM 20533 = JCM 1125]|uniref:Major facilitator superfamily (MFS) profile domain-containing protein n=3 Tax=Amylolactobacillus TaxID=2767876 RepID=A0A1L6XB30_9LACO|nr:hypothetical protein LA20533_02305 [Amylolactobacillus amylophilus DSM 20533 = JCM 1125]